MTTRLSLVAVLAACCALATGSLASGATVQAPADGATVTIEDGLPVHWTNVSGELYTGMIVFTRVPDIDDPVWDVDTLEQPGVRVDVGKLTSSSLTSGENVPFLSAWGFTPGVWYWRLANQIWGDASGLLTLDDSVRSITILPKPVPQPVPVLALVQPAVQPVVPSSPKIPLLPPSANKAKVSLKGQNLTTVKARSAVNKALVARYGKCAKKLNGLKRASTLQVTFKRVSCQKGKSRYAGTATVRLLQVNGSIKCKVQLKMRRVG